MQYMAVLTSCQLSQSLTGQRQNLPREFQIFKNFCIRFCNVNTRFPKMEIFSCSAKGSAERRSRQANAGPPDVWPP